MRLLDALKNILRRPTVSKTQRIINEVLKISKKPNEFLTIEELREKIKCADSTIQEVLSNLRLHRQIWAFQSGNILLVGSKKAIKVLKKRLKDEVYEARRRLKDVAFGRRETD